MLLLPMMLAGLGAAAAAADAPQVLLIPGAPSHGYGAHEFRAGAALLADALNGAESPVRARLAPEGLSPDFVLPADVDAVVLYMDGGETHPLIPHLAALDARVAAGLGVVVLHYALEVPTGPPGDALGRWIGGFYESGWSTNPTWGAELWLDPEHPITRGVAPFYALDEWYFSLRFADEAAIRPFATAIPDDEARANPTWPPFAKDHVLQASGRRETLAWSLQRADGGRGVGFAGGHFHWNWGHDDFRRLVLNAIVWAAGAEVPPGGVASETPSFEDLSQGQDEPEPWFFFDRDDTIERFDLRTRDEQD